MTNLAKIRLEPRRASSQKSPISIPTGQLQHPKCESISHMGTNLKREVPYNFPIKANFKTFCRRRTPKTAIAISKGIPTCFNLIKNLS